MVKSLVYNRPWHSQSPGDGWSWRLPAATQPALLNYSLLNCTQCSALYCAVHCTVQCTFHLFLDALYQWVAIAAAEGPTL